MGYVKGRGGRWTIEAAARALLTAKSIEAKSEEEMAEREALERSPRVRVSLPRVNFLERPYPDWWNDPEISPRSRPGG